MWTSGIAWLENMGGLWLPVLLKQVIFSTILFAIVLGLTTLLRKQSPLLHLGLWTLVLVRLILPTDLSLPYSARTLIGHMTGSLKRPASTTIQSRIADQGLSDEIAITDSIDDSPLISAGTAGTEISDKRIIPWKSVLFGGWLTGAFILLAVYLKRLLGYHRMVRKAEAVVDKKKLENLEHWKSLYRIRRPVRFVTSDEYLSPFTVGIFRPVVYLPKAVAETDNDTLAEAVISHELAHVRCYDALWMKLQNLIQIVYFFHPVAWIAGSRIHLLRECICDSLVISKRKLSTETYGLGLLSVIKWNVFGTDEVAILPGFGSPRRKILQRIQNIKNTKNMGKITILVSAVGMIFLALFILPMSGKADKSEKSAITVEPESRSESSVVTEYKSKVRKFVSMVNAMKSKANYTATLTEIIPSNYQDVLSVDSGTVALIMIDPRETGNNVRIQHAGYFVTYMNLKEVLVTEGQRIRQWQPIGLVNQGMYPIGSRLGLTFTIGDETQTPGLAFPGPTNANSRPKSASKAFNYRECANGIVTMVDLISKFADDAGGKFELIMPRGQAISSFKDGQVREIVKDANSGGIPYAVWVQYPEYRLSYEGLDRVYVRKGEAVKQWQAIGRLGNWQAHFTDSSKLVMTYEFNKAGKTTDGFSDPEFSNTPENGSLMVDNSILANPVPDGIVSSPFGKRRDPIQGSLDNHRGVDIPGRIGKPVLASAEGTVLIAENNYVQGKGEGRHILIDHMDGFQTRYTQLDTVLVEKGQKVSRWQMIGRIGRTGRATGPHLHYEVIKDGIPVDPEKYVPFRIKPEKQTTEVGRIDKATSDILIHQLQEQISELTFQKAAYEAQLASSGMPGTTDAKLVALKAQIDGLKKQWFKEIQNGGYPGDRMADSLSEAICANLQRNLAKEILDQGSYENQLIRMGLKPSDDQKLKQMGWRIDGMKKELTRELSGKGGGGEKNIRRRLAPEIMRECLERLGELIPAKAAYLGQLKRGGITTDKDVKLVYLESAVTRLTESMEENLKYLKDGKNKNVEILIAQTVVPALQKEAADITIQIASYESQLEAMKYRSPDDEKAQTLQARLNGIQDEIIRQKLIMTKQKTVY